MNAALGAIADGLARRLRDVLLAERRLEGFAFTLEPGDAAERLAALRDDTTAVALARDVTLRALALGAEATNYRLLAALGSDPRPLGDVARAAGLPALAASERVGALAQVGLAARDLEHDAVAQTPAGRGLVELVDALSRDLAARGRTLTDGED